MAVASSIIAAVGVAASVAGTAYSVYQNMEQQEAQQGMAQNNLRIGQLQSQGATLTNQGQQRTTATQTALLDVERRKAALQTDTSKSVIQKQMELEELKRESNQLNRDFNDVSRTATVDLEGLNLQNDNLNRQADVFDREAEQLNRRVQFMQERRAQREAIRAGVSANSSAVARSVASGAGAGGNSAVAANRANIANQVGTAVMDASNQRQAGVTAVDIAANKRELGVQSRELGTQARGINYGLALGRFDLTDQQYVVNDKQFDVNNTISGIYLNAQDQNSALVNEGFMLNNNLVQQNQDTQNELLGIQKQIYELGGQNNMLSAQAASAGGLAQLGMGLSSVGNSFVNNSSTIGKIYDSMPSSAFMNNEWGWN